MSSDLRDNEEQNTPQGFFQHDMSVTQLIHSSLTHRVTDVQHNVAHGVL
jgi:hypothetical protein